MLGQTLQILGFIIWGFLLFNCLYLLAFSLAGHLRKAPPLQRQPKGIFRKFCLLVPAFRADEVVLESCLINLQHQYDGIFDIHVVADGLKAETLQTLRRMGVFTIEVSFENSTKGKALFAAMEALKNRDYAAAVVLDVDNVLGAGVLQQFNDALAEGYKVAQAHRTAKNTETAFALLDACNEEINNHIFRKGHFAWGMSPSLIGSGMAFSFSYLRHLLQGIGETVGEDKELDVRILRDKVGIAYLDQAFVYDEKTSEASGFTQQRTRWIATQVEFLRKYGREGMASLFQHGNLEFFDKIIQSVLLPRTLLLGLLGLLTVGSAVLSLGPSFLYWAGASALLAAALLLALPGHLFNRRLLRGVLALPYATWCMLVALLHIKKARQSFLPTQHKAKGTAPSLDFSNQKTRSADAF